MSAAERPGVGRIVHVRDVGDGICHAAIVTGPPRGVASRATGGRVNLIVFRSLELPAVGLEVPMEGLTGYAVTWHWPERDDG